MPSNSKHTDPSLTTGYLHSMETMGTLDGPGVRTIFFLQGCPLRCLYCHNPDSQAFTQDRPVTVEDIVRTANRYKSYYGTQGGVTFSGGEPLAQAPFLAEALEALKNDGFTTCIDTSGVASEAALTRILPFVDTVLLDIKAWDPSWHRQLTGVPIDPVNRFMDVVRKLPFTGRIWIRHVMMPGVTDTEQAMEDLVARIEPLRPWIDRIEILPYHRMGLEKYRELGRPYPLEDMPAMDKDRARELEAYAREIFRPSAKSH